MKKRVSTALSLLMLLVLYVCTNVLATQAPSTWKREMLIGDNREYYFTYLIKRDHPPNYYYFSDYMYLCKYTIKDQELKDEILIASVFYENEAAHDNWVRRDTAEQSINLGEYLVENRVSYAFPLEYTSYHKLGIDKTGIFIQEGDVKTIILNAKEITKNIQMSWDARIIAEYVPGRLTENDALYYVVVESGSDCIDTDFSHRIVVITKEMMRNARLRRDNSANLRTLIPVDGNLYIESIYNVDLNGDGKEEVVIYSYTNETSDSIDQPDCFIDVIGEDENNNRHNILHKELGLSNYLIEFVKLCEEGHKQILLTQTQGSGGYLDYILIGYGSNKRKPEILLSESSRFKGDITIKDGILLISDGGRLSSYKWDGTDFIQGQVDLEPLLGTGSAIVNYWTKDSKIMSDAVGNTIKIKKGVTLNIIRNVARGDDLDYSVRVMHSSIGILQSVADSIFPSFVAKRSGQTTVSIVSGYDWQNSLELKVIVE